MIEVWCDGSSGKDRSGGWCCILVNESNNCMAKFVGHALDTTNNRMELTSVLNGLMNAKAFKGQIKINSDSAYVVNCFKQGWHVKWRNNSWTTSGGQEVANRDLWEKLIGIALHPDFKDRIIWNHVRGHQGVYWNEEADKAAHEARMKAVQILKSGGDISA